DLSIDEMVIGFRGRWQYKQSKATLVSLENIILNLWLCDSATGYVIDILSYFGANTSQHKHTWFSKSSQFGFATQGNEMVPQKEKSMLCVAFNDKKEKKKRFLQMLKRAAEK
ncbi:piggyBac transposable element-derived protein 4, partial [Biomphalaria glabrata]